MRDQVWPHFARLVNFPANKLRSGNGETPTIIVFPGSAIQQTRFTGIPQSESGKKNKNRETERE